METTKKGSAKTIKACESDCAERIGKECWLYIKTVVDIVREPVLILDGDLRVRAANESFYRTFQVEPKDTEKKIVYELGNGQWNIPALRRLLEDILPQNTFFKGFEVTHEFPFIGRKDMILNAREIHVSNGNISKVFPPIIFLAMEDVTSMMAVADTLAVHVKELAAQNGARARELEIHIGELEKEILELKMRV